MGERRELGGGTTHPGGEVVGGVEVVAVVLVLAEVTEVGLEGMRGQQKGGLFGEGLLVEQHVLSQLQVIVEAREAIPAGEREVRTLGTERTNKPEKSHIKRQTQKSYTSTKQQVVGTRLRGEDT